MSIYIDSNLTWNSSSLKPFPEMGAAHMLFVMDTSSLIVLRKLAWLQLFQLQELEFIWPVKVSEELRLQKTKNKEILDLLASGAASERPIQQPIKIEDISLTDAEVISLAVECQAVVVSEDTLLRQKAVKLALTSLSIAALFRLLYVCGILSKDEYVARLKSLHDKKFLSKSEYRRLLQGMMP